MRETVAEYEARTGHPYAPAPWLAGVGERLGPSDACPTLFRYPGPCGLRDHLGLTGFAFDRLGPPSITILWACEATTHTHGGGARHFGTLALLQPLRFGFCPGRLTDPPRGPDGTPMPLWCAENRPLDADDAFVWVPPSAIDAELPWDELRTPDDARAAIPGWAAELDDVKARLGGYLAELAAMAATGQTGPGVPWCDVPADERLQRLRGAGVTPLWTSAG